MSSQAGARDCEAGVGLIELAFLLITAGVVGFVGQFISGASKGGCPVSVAAALIGGFGGPRLARWLDYPEPWAVNVLDATLPVATTLAGALILVLLVNLVTHGRRW